MPRPHFNGPDYEPALDHARLTRQVDRIRQLMLDGQWRTLYEIAEATGDPESSISAQLRHLRKLRFGSYLLEKRRRGEPKEGLFEYRLLPSDTEADAPQARVRFPDLLDQLRKGTATTEQVRALLQALQEWWVPRAKSVWPHQCTSTLIAELDRK